MDGSELRSFIEEAPVAAAMFDEEMRYIAASQRWLTERNLDKTIIGRTAYDVYPDIETKFRSQFQRALAGEAISRPEDRFEVPHGAVEWVRWEMRPWRNAQGEIRGVVLFAEDITARKRAEAALQEREERFRYAMDAAQDGIWDWDLETDRVTFSPGYFRMLGYEIPEFEVRDLGIAVDLLHPDDREKTMELARKLLCSPGQYELEFRLRAKNGSYRWIVSRAKAVKWNEKGMPIRAVGTHTDITDRKEIEETLRHSQERLIEQNEELEALYLNAPIGICLLDQSLRFRRINNRLAEINGLSIESHIGRTVKEVVPTLADEAERITQSVVATRAPVTDVEFSGETQSAPGITRYWNESWYPIFSKDHVITGFGVVVEEVTSKRAALEEMERARAMAEETARAKANFLANMSHEIRTPMNAVIGMTHLALKADPSPRVRSYLQKIEYSSQNLLRIVNDILDYSKIDANKMPIESVDFGLDQLLEDAIGLVIDAATARGLKLIVQVDGDVPRQLVGDPLRLNQVLVNYLNNAIKFSENADIFIEVRAIQRSNRDVTLRFSVRDNGIGIADEQRQKLFQIFQQVDDSTTRKYGGTGLGLAIVKRLAEAMGGDVGVESALGQGATFWFTAKLRLGHNRRRSSVCNEISAIAANGLRGFKILLVEDNELNEEVAAELLKGFGLYVDVATNGALAVEMAQKGDYDLILMDVQMPVMDGITATNALRKEPRFKNLPILAMTANVMSSDREECLKAGMNDHIGKPLEPEALRDALIKWLPVPSAVGVTAKIDQSPSHQGSDLFLREPIEGLDIEGGLRRVAGNSALYISLLRKFGKRCSARTCFE